MASLNFTGAAGSVQQQNPLNSAVLTMTSRVIAELTRKDIAHVHRDIRSMLTELKKDDPDLDHPQEDKDSRGYTTCFYLNRELTETLLTGYSATARLRVVRRWHELEEQVSKPVDPMQILNDPAAMRGLLLGYTEKVLELEAKVEKIQPMADALVRIAHSEGSLCLTDAAKVLQIQRKKLILWLETNHWCYRRGGKLRAYDTVRPKYLVHKVYQYEDSNGDDKSQDQVMVTPTGIAKLALVMNVKLGGGVLQ